MLALTSLNLLNFNKPLIGLFNIIIITFTTPPLPPLLPRLLLGLT